MGAFDAELHLRLLGEQTLAGASDDYDEPPWAHPLRAVASALTAVGAIDPETAKAVVDDYRLAAALRDEDGFDGSGSVYLHQPAPAQNAEPLVPRRVVSCNRVLEHDNGVLQVRYVALADDATTMAITFRSDAPLPHRRHGFSHRMRAMPVMGWGPSLTQVTDDRGTTAPLRFSGSHDGREWRGHLEAVTPLAPDTAWLEIDGKRVDLVDGRAPVDVTVEELPEQDPARRCLWNLAASAWRDYSEPSPNLRLIADALIAAGALAPEDPCIEQVDAVLNALLAERTPQPAVARSLPEPWGSLVARLRRADGPYGTVLTRAVTPAFDGITLAVGGLDSMPDCWQVEVDVVPGTALQSPDDEDDEDDDVAPGRLTWWARDDRGNAYLGEVEELRSADLRASARVEFRPPLDPKATHVDLMPTAETHRAVIRVPLTWRALQGEPA